jgi:catalase
VALLLAEGADTEGLQELHAQLLEAGAVPRYVGPKLGTVAGIDVEVSLEAAPSVLFDATVLPDGAAAAALANIGHALEFIKDQYRHCKPILALGRGEELLAAAGIPKSLPNGKADPGLLRADGARGAAAKFKAAIAKHRHFERFSDPPRV